METFVFIRLEFSFENLNNLRGRIEKSFSLSIKYWNLFSFIENKNHIENL